MLHPRLRKAARRLELQTASNMQGTPTPASGAIRNDRLKGDVIAKHFRVECKLTEKQSYSVSRAVLDKIEREALSNCVCPLLSLQIDGKRFAVLRWEDFEQMTHDAHMI